MSPPIANAGTASANPYIDLYKGKSLAELLEIAKQEKISFSDEQKAGLASAYFSYRNNHAKMFSNSEYGGNLANNSLLTNGQGGSTDSLLRLCSSLAATGTKEQKAKCIDALYKSAKQEGLLSSGFLGGLGNLFTGGFNFGSLLS